MLLKLETVYVLFQLQDNELRVVSMKITKTLNENMAVTFVIAIEAIAIKPDKNSGLTLTRLKPMNYEDLYTGSRAIC